MEFLQVMTTPSPLRGECRHQIEGVRGVKRRVDVAHANLPSVRDGTLLRGECPVNPKLKNVKKKSTYMIRNEIHDKDDFVEYTSKGWPKVMFSHILTTHKIFLTFMAIGTFCSLLL
ncbi:hypothetical protein HanHA300_Chr04g0157811 [Helianthus annuus]|nr:hypothetical protein HanHA300_Chr04g0157811 [Helianthus annuus]KAJ0598940.1 hypothetical protein HanHA89_Chr04g0171211 [Helianthus annuus]